MARNFANGSERVIIPDSVHVEPAIPFTLAISMRFFSNANLVAFEKNGNDGFSVQMDGGEIAMNVGGPTNKTASLGGAYDDADWHRVCFVITGTTGNKIYIDGIDDSDTGTDDAGTAAYGTEDAFIGSRGGSFGFLGDMAEVAIWKGVTLTPPEAVALTTWARPDQVRPNSLSFYMPLLGHEAVERDLSPFKNHGTLIDTRIARHPQQIINPIKNVIPRSFYTLLEGVAPPAGTARTSISAVFG